MAKMVIFDTDILIDYLLGIVDARTFFTHFPRADRYTTVISLMEIYRGARNKQELNIFKRFFLTSFEEVLQINENVSRRAVELVEAHTLSHGLLLADALVAAVTLFNEAQLITGNRNHFDYISGLSVLVPPYRIKP